MTVNKNSRMANTDFHGNNFLLKRLKWVVKETSKIQAKYFKMHKLSLNWCTLYSTSLALLPAAILYFATQFRPDLTLNMHLQLRSRTIPKLWVCFFLPSSLWDPFPVRLTGSFTYVPFFRLIIFIIRITYSSLEVSWKICGSQIAMALKMCLLVSVSTNEFFKRHTCSLLRKA